MDSISSIAVVAFAALIHASFQLSVSVLTLLGGHSIGSLMSRKKTVRLISGYVMGAGVMTLLTLSFVAFLLLHIFGTDVPLVVWSVACGIAFGVGIAVWLFYYRKGFGTPLWIPRSFARHLTARSKQTSQSVEAFSLGLTSVAAELIFILPTTVLAALILIELPGVWQLIGVLVYSIISLSGLLIVWAFIGSGKSLSRVQKWRETNKRFIQFSAGSALLVLGFFIYVTKVIAEVSGT